MPARATEVSDDDLPALRERMMAAPVPDDVAAIFTDGQAILHQRAVSGVSLAVLSSSRGCAPGPVAP